MLLARSQLDGVFFLVCCLTAFNISASENDRGLIQICIFFLFRKVCLDIKISERAYTKNCMLGSFSSRKLHLTFIFGPVFRWSLLNLVRPLTRNISQPISSFLVLLFSNIIYDHLVDSLRCIFSHSFCN